jgi:hypothetical protein
MMMRLNVVVYGDVSVDGRLTVYLEAHLLFSSKM